jgi:NAD(P)-dependent dehydrogenase (short-subunit alcohol dehydrogenase family)
MKNLKGKVAVITGGASGIGRAMAERFAEEGMHIVLADIEQDALTKAQAEMQADGADVLAVVTDVSKEASVKALAATTLEKFGVAHVLCNNAGVGASGKCWEISEADWQWVVGVDFWGVVYGIRHFVPIMLRSGEGGHVVNVASMAGLITGAGMAPYYTSKHAVVSLSESLFLELRQESKDVGVSVLCPGWVSTRIHESDRNRPNGPVPEDELDAPARQLRQRMRQALQAGMKPKEVAELVLQAIVKNTFYVLPHGHWKPLIQSRTEAILGEKAPSLIPPPELV